MSACPVERATWASCPGTPALISTLRPGELSYQPADGGARRFVAVAPGFCEVADDTVTVLTETAAPAEKIDAASATAERDELAAEYDRAQLRGAGRPQGPRGHGAGLESTSPVASRSQPGVSKSRRPRAGGCVLRAAPLRGFLRSRPLGAPAFDV